MKHTTRMLVSLLCAIMLLAFSAILVTFHLIITNYIESTAHDAIYFALDQNNSFAEADEYFASSDIDYGSSSTVAYWLWVDPNYTPNGIYLGKERDLARWCQENPDVGGGISYTQINDREYYVAQSADHMTYDGTPGIWLIYVDVTAETAMVHRVDLSMLVIMALCGIIACVTGIRIGVSIERGQERQKKFFENASHELKTPLMSIQGYAEGLYDGIIAEPKQAIAVIMNETDKMATLVDEILCLSRIESGETKLNIESVSVEDSVNNCLITLESVIMKKGLQIETKLASSSICADSAQFETAVINLLSNAVKYATHKIVITYDGKKLSIWNDGSLISKEDATHHFDRFYIGKNGNTGIGLALTKEIVERHGWTIRVENSGDGTQFIITFSH